MKRIILLIILAAAFLQGRAQKETYNWTFGHGAGLTWNTTRSMAATGVDGTADATLTGLPDFFNSSLDTYEGCFSLSDSEGNLLFYSDGMIIYNKNHAIMANGTGMGGHNSSGQSGIILPYPGSTNLYMAVSLGRQDADNLAYSIVDMSLNGGLGGVTSQKNIRFTNPSGITGESVTSIKHANGTDYWVVAPGKGTPTYMNAWLVSGSGVSAFPVVTECPPNFKDIDPTSSNGYFKFNADGTHFVWPTFSDNILVYGDFDTSTGMFSNIKLRRTFTRSYGSEFSPDQKNVFIKDYYNLYVYYASDLFSNPAEIPIYVKKVPLLPAIEGALQIGPDKRIYVSGYESTNFYVIDNVNDMDNMKIYHIPDFLSVKSGAGLPSFVASWFSADVKEKSFVCIDNDFKYSIEVSISGAPSEQPTKLVWDFGDGSATVTQNIVSSQTIYKQNHSYAATGDYTITITPYKANGAALSKNTLHANVVDCMFKTNRMIRVDLQNTATNAVNR